MGLAPYGSPRYADKILNNLIDIKGDGSFRLNMAYFDYCAGLRMVNQKFADLFGGPPFDPAGVPGQREMDIAASIQVVTEEVVIKLARQLQRETGAKNLCLAGGVALNCVANGRLLRERLFDRIWIQPAAGDAGGALGAAYATYHTYREQPRKMQADGDAMQGALLGPAYTSQEVVTRLDAVGAKYRRLGHEELYDAVAKLVAEENVIGWFQNRMEFGPRALGARSIIADSRSAAIQSKLNLKIKFRESFRPFAPAIKEEKLGEYFDLSEASPYMLLVAEVNESICQPVAPDAQGIEKLHQIRSTIPAVTHVDYSARIQTVNTKSNPEFYALLDAFDRLTGCPVLVNTSFNVRGEPIVCTPEDAYRCFMATHMDYLVIGDLVLAKQDQPEENKREMGPKALD